MKVHLLPLCRSWATILLFLAAVTVAGCGGSTGGTIAGLFPAPKLLKGEIKGYTYIAPENAFTVMVPHPEGTYEFKYMNVKEQYGDLDAYVSFGPAAMDKSIYRIEIGKRIQPSSHVVTFESAVSQWLENYKGQLQKAYGADLDEVFVHDVTIKDRKAKHWMFRQTVKSGSQQVQISHEICAIDFGHAVATASVQTPGVPHGHVLDARTFAESLTIQ